MRWIVQLKPGYDRTCVQSSAGSLHVVNTVNMTKQSVYLYDEAGMYNKQVLQTHLVILLTGLLEYSTPCLKIYQLLYTFSVEYLSGLTFKPQNN